ncbi:hypothetical protein BG000_008262 [Podila horticola]|nr:hypothetical protein BG000_008262 [Podila horticola]
MEMGKNDHQADTGSVSTASTEPDTIMANMTSKPNATTTTTTNNTTNASDTATSTTTKAITMDGYRKRALERQREQEKQKKHQKTDATTSSTISVHPHTPGPGQPPLSEDTQQPVDKVNNPTSAEPSAGASTKGGATSANGHPQHHHHRKAPSSQAPRTTSPPTPVSGGSVSAPSHKTAGPKGPKAIHAIELIRIAGEILQFPPATIGTSLVYYHKYRAYLHQAYKRGERDNEATKADEYLFATACLHLACKCTEVSRKVRDLVNVTYRVMNPNQPVLSLSTAAKPTEDNSTTLDSIPHLSNNANQQPLTYPTAPPPTAQTYWTIRDSLLTTELMLLRILQFDLDVALPFSDVLRIYKGMGMVFAPTDEEAAHIYPDACNFDVFLPSLHHQHHHHHSHAGSSSSTPNKHGTPSSTSSATLLSSLPNAGPHAPHVGIHPTLSALVQISITFCIDALCSSTIALNSSSRALAMGAIYLAIRSAGLELPLPFEDWCYAWGRPMIAAGFGISVSGGGGPAGAGGYGMGPGGSIAGSSTGGTGGVSGGGMNGLLGLATTNLFVSSPRPQQGEGGYMDGLELSNEPVGGGQGTGSGSSGAGSGALNGIDSVYSQNDSPQLLSNTLSPALLTGSAMDGLDGSLTHPPQPMTIVDEVRKVVQELGSFYTH